MTERDDLLNSIAKTIETYREGEIAKPTAEHVDRWVSQFTDNRQLPLLREFSGVIAASFYSRERVIAEIRDLIQSEAIAGQDPAVYWRSVNFLNIQLNGHSQAAMLELFDNELKLLCNLSLHQCGSPQGDYIYIDDISFTGDRVANDLTQWIQTTAPNIGKLHVVFLVRHTSGYYMEEVKIPEAKKRFGKTGLQVEHWYSKQLENRKEYRNRSDVYWPVIVPPAVLPMYPEGARFAHVPRSSLNVSNFFSSEAGRQVLEDEFLLAGVTIRSAANNPSPRLKPLGYGNFGLGFGSTLATYRNCPNTAPLAIWWGRGDSSGPLQWYPLLPRIGY